MTRLHRSLCAAALSALWAAAAGAQTTPAPATPPPSADPASDAATRPATATFSGDTGLWYVPTAEVLANGRWSVGGYRRGTNYMQGYTNVGDFAGTFGVGLRGRAEIFGAFLVDTRIDRDLRPIFVSDQNVGGVIDRYPKVNQYWSGDNVGDFYVGAKFNILSEYRQNPAAFAVRAAVKLPTANTDNGAGTGKADFSVDAIVSKEAAKRVEVSGFGGYEWRGTPDGFTTPSGAFRWGTGVAVPSRNFVRMVGELNGAVPSSDSTTLSPGTLKGIDGSVAPATSVTGSLTRATLGVTAQAKNGFFAGVGLSWNVPTRARVATFTDEADVMGDYYDVQFRIGYHPGARTYVPPPPPAPAPVQAAPPPPPRHDLAVKAACDPCSVEIGKTSTVTVTAQDSIACPLTYRWTAPSGTLAQPAERQTIWTAPNQDGSVPVTVTATCASDGKTASDTINIQVTRPPVKVYTFEDVYFDFDRYSLRPEATRVLDEAVSALRADPTLRVVVEGHTCSIGTAEYNLALGDRRATAVKTYLSSRGVTADRLTTISYGEERPKYDNAREETRRLNRRAALVVNLQR